MLTVTDDILKGRFQVIDCLKKDDHSAVYTAYDSKKKKVIIKVLNTTNLPDSSILERFKREAKILSGLEHPNINNVIEYWTDETRLFISFEHFESKNLRQYLKSSKPTEEQKRFLVKQLFQGLNYAHSKGIIHRDIKPENIIVNDKLELKIIDFGLALGMNDSLVTAQYSLVGTPSYMAPEQIQGERPSFKSDLFSAGIVAYEIYTGSNPFLGQDINDTLNKILSYDEAAHLELIDTLPPDIKEVISGLLKKEPDKRTESAAAVLSSMKEEHVKEFRINKRAFTAAALLIILTAALLTFLSLKPVPEQITNNVISPDSLSSGDNSFTLAAQTGTPSEQNPEQIKKEDPAAEKIDDAAPPSVTEAAIIKKGELSIECIPWAYVYIDSVRADVTPLKQNIILDEGNHLVRLVHPNYPAFNRVINIRPSQETKIKINLDTLFGYLDCKIIPWAEVYVNNSYKGETPMQGPIKLYPGNYKITLKNSSFADAEFSVKINQNQTYILKHSFKENN